MRAGRGPPTASGPHASADAGRRAAPARPQGSQAGEAPGRGVPSLPCATTLCRRPTASGPCGHAAPLLPPPEAEGEAAGQRAPPPSLPRDARGRAPASPACRLALRRSLTADVWCALQMRASLIQATENEVSVVLRGFSPDTLRLRALGECGR